LDRLVSFVAGPLSRGRLKPKDRCTTQTTTRATTVNSSSHYGVEILVRARSVLFSLLYTISFAVILCGAFTLMSQGFSARTSRPLARVRSHPEAPQHGESVLYVDLTRERLEQLYQQAS
jgi:hypothetical protein